MQNFETLYVESVMDISPTQIQHAIDLFTIDLAMGGVDRRGRLSLAFEDGVLRFSKLVAAGGSAKAAGHGPLVHSKGKLLGRNVSQMVEIELSVWSKSQTSVGIRPRLGQWAPPFGPKSNPYLGVARRATETIKASLESWHRRAKQMELI